MTIATLSFLIGIWMAGFILAKWMITAEHLNDNDHFTNGEKALMVFLSCLSWLIVLNMLVQAWIKSIPQYWSKDHHSSPKKDVE